MTRRRKRQPPFDPDVPLSHRSHGAILTDVALAERRIKAIRMRNQGYGLAHIAQECEVSVKTVQRDITEGLRNTMRVPVEDLVANHRAIMADIVKANYPAMLAGDKDASTVILKVIERESKLFGLDAPQRVNVGVNDEQFADTVASLLAQIGVDNVLPERRMIEGEIVGEVADDATGDVVQIGDTDATATPDDEWADSAQIVPDEWID